MPLSTIGRSPGAASWPRTVPSRCGSRLRSCEFIQSPADPLPAIGGRRAKSRRYLNPGFGCLRCAAVGVFVAWVMRRRLPARAGPRRLTPRARRQGCPAGDRWSRSGDQQHVGCQLQQPLQCDLWPMTPDRAALWMTTGLVSAGLATPRGPELAPPILLAVWLNVAAVRGSPTSQVSTPSLRR
jgi:hypothetical protein